MKQGSPLRAMPLLVGENGQGSWLKVGIQAKGLLDSPKVKGRLQPFRESRVTFFLRSLEKKEEGGRATSPN